MDFTSAIERFDIPRELIQRLKDEGVPNADIVGKALGEMGMDMDLVTNMANTAQGRMSTFQDTLVVLAGSITQPIFDVFSSGLGGVNEALSANMPALQSFAGVLSGKVKEGIDFVANVAIPGLINGWNQIQPVVQPIIGLLASNLQPILTGVGLTITALVVPAIATGVAAFLSVAAPIAAMVAIGALLSSAWSNNFLGIKDITTSVINAVSSVITSVMNSVQSFWKGNQDQISGSTKSFWSDIQNLFSAATLFVSGVIKTATAAWNSFFTTNKEQIAGIVSGLWTYVQGAFQVGSSLVTGIVRTLTAILKGDWSGAGEAIKTMVSGMWSGIKTMFSGGMQIVQNVVQIGLNAAKGPFESFKSAVSGIVQGIKENVTGKIQEIIGFIQGLGSRFSSAGSALINNMRDGFINAIGDLINAARKKLSELTDLLPGSEPKDPSSPLRGLAHRGEALVKNFQTGIDRASLNLAPVMDKLTANMPSTSPVSNAGTTYGNQTNINVNMPSLVSANELIPNIELLQGLYG